MSKGTRAEWRVFLPSQLSASSYATLLTIADNAGGRKASCVLLLEELIASIEADDAYALEGKRLVVAASILLDLIEQFWEVRTNANQIEIRPPHDKSLSGEDLTATKSRLRRQLLVASNRQLATKGTSDFLSYMHRERQFAGKNISILSLIDDGASLANLIKNNREEKKLKRIFQPYVQVCSPGTRCEFTGLKLLDIWRYFRHTWALEYNPVPGRSMRVLVRNKARPNHPIMGITMLSSAPANLAMRDRWIGWSVDDLVQKIVNSELSAKVMAGVLVKALERSIKMIRSDDLIQPEELERPSKHTLVTLSHNKILAGHARKSDLVKQNETDNSELIDIRSLSMEKIKDADWLRLSETSLFKRKRAETLYNLLSAKIALRNAGIEKHPAAALLELLTKRTGRRVISIIIDEIRKEHLATQIADLSVCGAVPPYGGILGGKLVALLMTSKEIQQAYRQRYGNQISEIASQMAGKPVVRDSTLRLLTTTSLYGIASSQYNRLKLRPGTFHGVKNGLSWVELGKTEGFTVTHLSNNTLLRMRVLSDTHYGMRRINSVFGEGSSPRTRRVREALHLIGVQDDQILKQGLSRRLYAIELQPNAREILNEHEKTKSFSQPSARAISNAWILRWVTGRVHRPEVIDRINEHRPELIKKQFEDRIADVNDFLSATVRTPNSFPYESADAKSD